jgi:hypothetical protein
MKTNKFMPIVLAVAGLGIAAISNGCSAANSLCCKQYNPGTDMTNVKFTADATVNGQFVAMAQAAGDLAAVSGQAQLDVTNACKGIATDLGEDSAGGAGMAGADLMNFWCGKAKAQLSATSLTIKVVSSPAHCDMQVSVQADCKAHCDVNGKCDLMATPPTCTGGTLDVDCKGSCDVTVMEPKIDCTGTCMANCEGSCTAMGGVMCAGRCDGMCSAATDAQGNCMGMCSGTCRATAPGVMCMGTCEGKCTGKCAASGGSASVHCSGKCDAMYTPLECKGGKLEGGCKVDANCEGSCNASASAKAQCTPPEIKVSITGTGPKLALVQATLETNLKAIAVVYQARAKTFVDSISATATVAGSIVASGKLDVGGAACGAFIVDNVATTTSSFSATLSASTSIATMVGM